MRADRLLSLLMLLQTKGRMTAQDLAERLEVSERTIYRDLIALSASGVPVYAERGPGGGCGLIEGYRTTLTGLNEAEARTIFIAGALGPLADLGLGTALEAALLKLLAALPSTRRNDAERARQRLHVDGAGWGRHNEISPHLCQIQEAVWQERKLLIAYRQGRDGSERWVEPLGLVAKASIWYLVARSAGEMRVFRVSRIQRTELSDETFERPPDFDLAMYWAEARTNFEASWPQYRVTVRVAPEIAPMLPQHFGESIYTTLEGAAPPDASGWITLPLTFDSLEMARCRLLGLGPEVEVIEPLELRESVIAYADRVAAFYHRQEARQH